MKVLRMIQLLESLFGHQSSMVVYDLIYVMSCNACIAILLLKINCIDRPVRRCVWFSVLMTLVVVVPSNAIIAIRMMYVQRADAGEIPYFLRALIVSLFSYRNPLWLSVYFVTARRILGLSKRSVASSALIVFFFSELTALASDSAEYLYLPFKGILSPFAGFAIAELMLILSLATASAFVLRYVDRNIHRLKMLFEVGSEYRRGIGTRSFWAACCLWSVLALGQIIMPTNPSYAKPFFMFTMLVVIGTLIALIIRNRFTHIALYQEQLRYDILYEMSEEFRGWQHDTNNILQIYEGFIQVEDLTGLKAFHTKLFKNSESMGDQLDYLMELKDSPALYGLFLSMNTLAVQSDVHLDVSNVRLFIQIDIPDLDLCRLLTNLMKNAIESASLTEDGSVKVSISRSGDQHVVISITNDTPAPVDTARMFQKGFTSKEGHTGRGLSEVNKILAKYYGCTITADYEDQALTMYVHLPRTHHQPSAA